LGSLWENHFPNNLSHLEIVAYRPNNLLLQSTGLTTCLFKPTPKSNRVKVMATTKLGIEQMMAASHTQSRNYVGNKKKPLRHGTSLGKVQVHYVSQEKYGIAQSSYRFQRCVNDAEVDDEGNGSVRESVGSTTNLRE
jgi:hypothetical protein